MNNMLTLSGSATTFWWSYSKQLKEPYTPSLMKYMVWVSTSPSTSFDVICHSLNTIRTKKYVPIISLLQSLGATFVKRNDKVKDKGKEAFSHWVNIKWFNRVILCSRFSSTRVNYQMVYVGVRIEWVEMVRVVAEGRYLSLGVHAGGQRVGGGGEVAARLRDHAHASVREQLLQRRVDHLRHLTHTSYDMNIGQTTIGLLYRLACFIFFFYLFGR